MQHDETMTTYEIMNPKDIQLHAALLALFRDRPSMMCQMEGDIRTHHHHCARPFVLGSWAGRKEPVCVEDYNRLQAMKSAGVTEAPVELLEFRSFEDAARHFIKTECRRRKKPLDSQIMQLVERIDNRRLLGPNPCSDEEVGELLGVTAGEVHQVRALLSEETDIRRGVEQGEVGIEEAYEYLRERRRHLAQAHAKTEKMAPTS